MNASAFGDRARAVEEIFQRLRSEPAALMTMLVELERTLGPLPPEAITFVATRLRLPRAGIEALAAGHRILRTDLETRRLGLCVNGACAVRGGAEVERVLREKGIPFEPLRCQGACDLGPIACYNHGAPLAISAARARSMAKADPADWEDILSVEKPVHAFKTEPRVAFANIFAKGSHQLPTARRHGVYRVVEQALQGRPEDVLRAVADSGLVEASGEDGPVAPRWEQLRAAGEPRYLVVNAMESVPGTFKDRVLIERDPHLIIAGTILAAWAAGASEAYLVLRGEYELAIERARGAVEEAMRTGILGERVMGRPFALQLRVRLAPSSFRAAEAGFLVEALEGRAPIAPADRKPVAESGLFGRPTVVHNPETLASLPAIVTRGGEWYRGLGVGGATGLKIVSISGDVKRAGDYEVPRGTPLRALIEMAGGLAQGKTLTAMQIGGPSEPYLRPEQLDLALDDAALAGVGARVGSGAVLVVSEKGCLYDLARRETVFLAREGCGFCEGCLKGTPALVGLLEGLAEDPERAVSLEGIGAGMRENGCRIARRAMLPAETLLARFPEAVHEHAEGQCACFPRKKQRPAGSA